MKTIPFISLAVFAVFIALNLYDVAAISQAANASVQVSVEVPTYLSISADDYLYQIDQAFRYALLYKLLLLILQVSACTLIYIIFIRHSSPNLSEATNVFRHSTSDIN